MTKEQDMVETLSVECLKKPPKWRVTISIADDIPDLMGLPRFSSRDNLRSRILAIIAKETK